MSRRYDSWLGSPEGHPLPEPCNGASRLGMIPIEETSGVCPIGAHNAKSNYVNRIGGSILDWLRFQTVQPRCVGRMDSVRIGTLKRVRHVTFMLSLALVGQGVAVAQSIIFVDDDAPGATHDGTTWCTALTDLQEALALAPPGSQVRVAQGTYTPTSPGGVRIATFQLPAGVAVIGGYAGCGAPDPDARDPELTPSILSGDLNGDDDTGGDNSENSYHVVTLSGLDDTTVLDGFVITAGFANGPNPSDRGGGIFIFPVATSATIRRCTVRNNHVIAKGGGIYAFRFTGRLSDCTVTDNSAADGGGLYFLQGAPMVEESTISFNVASALGGGVFSLASDPNYYHCVITSNGALGGGGIQSASSNPVVDRCRIVANTASGLGNPSGGGMLNQESALTISNSVISGNTATVAGGGLHNTLNSTVSIANTLFSRNSAEFTGGVSSVSGHISALSAILWENDDAGGVDESAQIGIAGGTADINYSDVQGLTGSLGGDGNISDAPLFADENGPDGVPGTLDDDYRLSPSSPCINTGDPALAPGPAAIDLEGNNRVICGRVDIGPSEFGTEENCNDNTVAVPALSHWGILILALLILVGGKLSRPPDRIVMA